MRALRSGMALIALASAFSAMVACHAVAPTPVIETVSREGRPTAAVIDGDAGTTQSPAITLPPQPTVMPTEELPPEVEPNTVATIPLPAATTPNPARRFLPEGESNTATTYHLPAATTPTPAREPLNGNTILVNTRRALFVPAEAKVELMLSGHSGDFPLGTPLDYPFYKIYYNDEVAEMSATTGQVKVGVDHVELFWFFLDEMGDEEFITIDNVSYEEQWGPIRAKLIGLRALNSGSSDSTATPTPGPNYAALLKEVHLPKEIDVTHVFLHYGFVWPPGTAPDDPYIYNAFWSGPVYRITYKGERVWVAEWTGHFLVGEEQQDLFWFLFEQLGNERALIIPSESYEEWWGEEARDRWNDRATPRPTIPVSGTPTLVPPAPGFATPPPPQRPPPGTRP